MPACDTAFAPVSGTLHHSKTLQHLDQGASANRHAVYLLIMFYYGSAQEPLVILWLYVIVIILALLYACSDNAPECLGMMSGSLEHLDQKNLAVVKIIGELDVACKQS